MYDFETSCYQDRADWHRLLVAYSQAEERASIAEALAAKTALKNSPGTTESGHAAAISLTVSSTEVEDEESATGWVPRVSQLDGVDRAQLSTLHGRVIALGLLKFKLIDRHVGLRYRLTPAGRQAVKSPPEAGAEAADAA